MCLMLSIFLDSNTEDNGPIKVLPGSHCGPIYSHTNEEGVFSGFINHNKSQLPLKEFVAMIGEVGDVAMHHYRTAHYSEKNISNRPRRLLLLRFAAADAWPIMGALDFFSGFDFKQLKARIVLGEQTTQPRMMAVPLQMPYPSAVKFKRVSE